MSRGLAHLLSLWLGGLWVWGWVGGWGRGGGLYSRTLVPQLRRSLNPPTGTTNHTMVVMWGVRIRRRSGGI